VSFEYHFPIAFSIEWMIPTAEDLCVTCNDRDGVTRQPDLVAGGGEIRQYELVLCGVCAAAFDDSSLTTVTVSTDSQLAER
jgi:hypothetical protein